MHILHGITRAEKQFTKEYLMPIQTEEYDWRRVVEELQPKGCCELQDHTNCLVYHRPIESITLETDDVVRITLKWVAQMPIPGQAGFGRWKPAPDNMRLIEFRNQIVPFIEENVSERGKRIRFDRFHIIYINKNVESDQRIFAQAYPPAG